MSAADERESRNCVVDKHIQWVELCSTEKSHCIRVDIVLKQCPKLSTPPLEVARRGTQTILGYMRKLKTGKTQCWRTKLMFVGLGGAGKTTLLTAMRTKQTTAQMTPVTITDGIDIAEWTVKTYLSESGKDVTIN
jgi:hypothetical protein